LYCTKRSKKQFYRYGEWQEHEGCFYSNMRWHTPESIAQKLFRKPWQPRAEPKDVLGYHEQQDFSDWIGTHYNKY